jgi:hypothetical protein
VAVAQLLGHEGLALFPQRLGQPFAFVKRAVVVADVRSHPGLAGRVHFGRLVAGFFAQHEVYQAFLPGQKILDSENGIG